MKTVLITGARGFVGRNLVSFLERRDDVEIRQLGSDDFDSNLVEAVRDVDVVVHLAGVNRPPSEEQFDDGNAGVTKRLCQALSATGRAIPVIYSSTIQVERDGAYGLSKRKAEEILLLYAGENKAPVYLYRLPNIFGKWSRPEYNTVVATFCHKISRGLPVTISDRSATLTLAYVDDVVACFTGIVLGDLIPDPGILPFENVHQLTLGELHDTIAEFEELRRKERVPDMGTPLLRKLYATFTSFLDPDDLSYPVDLKTDNRGWLFELLKSPSAGQIFVSTTRPGITRGNHFHHSKVEKFCVIQGEGVIRFRALDSGEIQEYHVSGSDIRVVVIPPGRTHSIENSGDTDLLTLFWANEIFDPEHPDTYFENVLC